MCLSVKDLEKGDLIVSYLLDLRLVRRVWIERQAKSDKFMGIDCEANRGTASQKLDVADHLVDLLRLAREVGKPHDRYSSTCNEAGQSERREPRGGSRRGGEGLLASRTIVATVSSGCSETST